MQTIPTVAIQRGLTICLSITLLKLLDKSACHLTGKVVASNNTLRFVGEYSDPSEEGEVWGPIPLPPGKHAITNCSQTTWQTQTRRWVTRGSDSAFRQITLVLVLRNKITEIGSVCSIDDNRKNQHCRSRYSNDKGKCQENYYLA